jgi:hypothetical protein
MTTEEPVEEATLTRAEQQEETERVHESELAEERRIHNERRLGKKVDEETPEEESPSQPEV